MTTKPHLLIVRFKDNDYASYYLKACVDFLQAIVDGERGWSLERLQEILENGGEKAIGQGLMMAAWGYSIVADGTYVLRSCGRVLGWQENPTEIYQRIEDRKGFMQEDIEVTATIEEFERKWENSEVCYIDFKSCEVHLQ